MRSRLALCVPLSLALLSLACLVPAAPASSVASPVTLVYDVPAHGWAMSHLLLDGTGIVDVTWRIVGGPDPTEVYVMPGASIVEQPSWLTPWPTGEAALAAGVSLDETGSTALLAWDEDRPDLIVAIAASAPVHVEITYTFLDAVTFEEIERVTGGGALVDVDVATLGEAAAVAARIDAPSGGWVALDLQLSRAAATAAGVVVMERAGAIDACHLEGVATTVDTPDDEGAVRFHMSRGTFDAPAGRAAIAHAGVQAIGDARASAVRFPVTGIGALLFDGDYASSYTSYRGAQGIVGYGCTL